MRKAPLNSPYSFIYPLREHAPWQRILHKVRDARAAKLRFRLPNSDLKTSPGIFAIHIVARAEALSSRLITGKTKMLI
ncbi:MAG TPA: hypothetical protein VJS44_14420 [Pyrinomonadaceae bacterium]|nr:hypothetical protein [Pyrinomonadaceae bacterium]